MGEARRARLYYLRKMKPLPGPDTPAPGSIAKPGGSIPSVFMVHTWMKAGDSAGASINRFNSLSNRISVIEQPAMSREVT